MEEAVDILTETKTHNVIKVSVSPSFASKWLVPRLASYYKRRPDAIVKISATMALTDFKVEDVDIAIRYGSGKYPGMNAEEVLRETVFPVCSPGLLEEGKKLCSTADLLNHTLIHDDSFSQDDSAPSWSMWLRAAGVETPDGLPALHFNTHSLAIEAAVAGRGVALARSAIAEEDLKAGRLVRLFDEAVPVGFAHYVVQPSEKQRSERVQDFVDWLKEEAGTPVVGETDVDAA